MTKNEIIEQLFRSKDFNDCICRMEPEHLQDELKQEVILVLLELPEEKVKELHEAKALQAYTVRTIINSIQSNTSPFYKKYRRHNLQIFDGQTGFTWSEMDFSVAPIALERKMDKEYGRIHSQDTTTIEDRKEREDLGDRAMAILRGLYWYDKALVEMYLRVGSFRLLEEETYQPAIGRGIPWQSCYKSVKGALKKIKHAIITT